MSNFALTRDQLEKAKIHQAAQKQLAEDLSQKFKADEAAKKQSGIDLSENAKSSEAPKKQSIKSWFEGAGKKIAKGVGAVFGGVGSLLVNAGKILVGVLKTFDRFPLNLVCGLILILMTIFRELMKVREIGYTVAFLVHVLPFVAQVIHIFARYTYFTLTTALMATIDLRFRGRKTPEGAPSADRVRSGIRNMLMFMQSCHPDPRQWYAYPQSHFGNTHETRLGLACMSPCPARYLPFLGGLFCRRTDGRVPQFCPRAAITRAVEGMDLPGARAYPDAAFMQRFREACASQEPPVTAFEERTAEPDPAREVLARGVCAQADLVLKRPEEVYLACTEAYCRRGSREPFCSRLDYDFRSVGAEGDLAQLLKVPGLAVMAAAMFTLARYLMQNTIEGLAAGA